MGGGKGRGSQVNVQPSPYESILAKIAQDLYDSTANLRSGFIGDFEKILGVGRPSGGQSQAGQGAPIQLQSRGYTEKNGVWYPFQADPKGYYTDESGNLYPGSSVRYIPSDLTAFGLGDTSAHIYYGPDGATVKVKPTQLTPSPAGLADGGGIGVGQGGNQAQSARYDPTQLPAYKPLFGIQKQSLESQYQQARKNLMGAIPQGGNLAGALSGLESNRAAAVGALPAELASGILGDLLNKAYGVAFQAPTTTLSGLATAAGTFGNRQAAAMAQSAANQQSTYGLLGQLGGAVGEGIGKAIGGK